MKERTVHTLLTFTTLTMILSFIITAAMVSVVSATDYPQRAIAIIVGSSPGGGFDLQARLFCKYWPKYFPKKVTMIIRNITGGGGLRSANQAWIAKPDGYTIVQIKTGAYIIAEILHPSRVKFKMKEWQYIGRYTYNVNALVMRTEIWKKVKNYQDLVNYAKKKPLVYTTGGVGSSMHNNGLVFSEATKIPMRYVHFPGAVQALASIMRAEADFTIFSVSTAMQRSAEEIRIQLIFNDEKKRFTAVAPSALEFGVPENVLQKINSNPVFNG